MRRQGEFRLALKPPDGEPPVAGTLTVRVSRLDDGRGDPRPAGALPLRPGRDSDLVFYAARRSRSTRPRGPLRGPRRRGSAAPVRLPQPGGQRFPTASRSPRGSVRPRSRPRRTASSSWRPCRPARHPRRGPAHVAAEPVADPRRPPVTVAVLFDTSLSHRWSGLETAYADLVRVLRSLRRDDRFALVPFDRRPGRGRPAGRPTPEAIEACARRAPRAAAGRGDRPPAGARGRAAGRRQADGRLILLTDGQASVTSQAPRPRRAGRCPLFTIVTGDGDRAKPPDRLRPAARGSTATEVKTSSSSSALAAPLDAGAPHAARAAAEPRPFPSR